MVSSIENYVANSSKERRNVRDAPQEILNTHGSLEDSEDNNDRYRARRRAITPDDVNKVEPRPTSAGKKRIYKLQAHLKRGGGMPLEEIVDHQKVSKSTRPHHKEPMKGGQNVKKIIKGLVNTDTQAEKENIEVYPQHQMAQTTDRQLRGFEESDASKLQIKDSFSLSRNSDKRLKKKNLQVNGYRGRFSKKQRTPTIQKNVQQLTTMTFSSQSSLSSAGSMIINQQPLPKQSLVNITKHQ